MNLKIKQFIADEEAWGGFKEEIIKRLESQILKITTGLSMEDAFADYNKKVGLLMIEVFLKELEESVYGEIHNPGNQRGGHQDDDN